MGTFHTICNMLSMLCKCFGDAGLKDVLTESQIVAEGSINCVIEGKQYNRAIKVHKCVYEVYCNSPDPNLLVSASLLLEQVVAMSRNLKQDVFDKLHHVKSPNSRGRNFLRSTRTKSSNGAYSLTTPRAFALGFDMALERR